MGSAGTFYAWRRRRGSGKERWFEELSHAAASCPHLTPEGIAERIIAVQRQFPHFGLKKIKAWLAEKEPAMVWPARRNRR